MSFDASQDFELADKTDHTSDPALAVDGLFDFLPAQITLDMESALAVGTLGDFFPGPGGEADAVDPGPGGDADVVDYFTTADEAPATIRELPVETPVPVTVTVDDEVCEPEQVFESGDILQTDIQRAALEFQRFAEKFHAFATGAKTE